MLLSRAGNTVFMLKPETRGRGTAERTNNTEETSENYRILGCTNLLLYAHFKFVLQG